MLFADVEADGFLPDATRLWCIGIGEESGDVDLYADYPGYRPIKEGLDRLKEAEKIVFHHGMGYDFWAINKIYPGTLRFDQIVDSLILMRMADPEAKQSLEVIGERLGFKKGSHTDFSQFSHQMAEYCQRDVQILQRLWPTISKYYETYTQAVACEHRVGYVLAKQEQHGFRFDVAAAQALEADLRAELRGIKGELQAVFPPIIHERWSEKTGKRLKDKIEEFNPASRQQIGRRLTTKYKWKPKKFTNNGQPQIDESILSGLDYPEAKLLARYLRTEKLLGQLSDGDNGWLKKVTPQGYIHGKVNQCGARTHRMSHFGPNLAQVDKDSRMRSLFIPDPGMVLVGCDAEGIELRLLGHYLYPYDSGAFIKVVTTGSKSDGTDAHSLNRKYAGLKTRDGAKTLIYALIYGAGNPKLGKIWTEDTGVKVNLRQKGEEVRLALETGIVGFGSLIKDVKSKHNKRGYFRCLDGRPIRSDGEHSALNTVIQSAGAIVMKYALILFDEEIETRLSNVPIYYCANVHDEVQLSTIPEYAEEVGQLFADCITRAGELLGIRCPLAGSYAVGNNWQETH